MTRKRQKELNTRLAEEKRLLLNDVDALTRQFERQRPPLKKRIRKEKKLRSRENKKISEF